MPTGSRWLPLRLSILAAAGLGPGCSLDPLGDGSTATTSASSASATTGATSSSAGGAGTTSATSTSSATGTGGAGGAGDSVCAGAVKLPSSDGTDSGFAQCPDETVHRNTIATCDPTIDEPVCTGSEDNVTCATDSDCTDGPNGRCVHTTVLDDLGPVTNCSCQYACANDAECGAGNVCVCNGVVQALDENWSTCAPATCLVNSDCASGECALSDYYDGCRTNLKLGCTAPTDMCRTLADCDMGDGIHRVCALFTDAPDAPATWQCKAWSCVIGRPFIVDGEVKHAARIESEAWCDGATERRATNEAERRAALAHWSEVAALEHASIASFARFTLELLAMGAPSELVMSAQRAGLDEVEHARIAYGIASSFAGRSLGPGKLDLGVGMRARTAFEIVDSLVDEGCVGETLGAIEATLLADARVDATIREACKEIATDEQRHAELAWRTLAWLVAEDPTGAIGRRANARFDRALAALETDPPANRVVCATHGVFASTEIGALRREAAREILRPCAEALVGSLGAHSSHSSSVTS